MLVQKCLEDWDPDPKSDLDTDKNCPDSATLVVVPCVQDVYDAVVTGCFLRFFGLFVILFASVHLPWICTHILHLQNSTSWYIHTAK
jgi:hypothetical protein